MSSAPMRIPAGFTQDMSVQPLGLLGIPNPAFYATWFDDFMSYVVANYTATINANGTIAGVAGGKNGRILFTTNSSTPLAADINELQTLTATIIMEATRKTSFLTRINSAGNLAVFQLGLIQKTTTPATIVDGMVATRATSGTGWLFRVIAGSAVTGTLTIPDTTSGYAPGTDCDIGMVYDGRGEVLCFIGTNLSGTIDNQNTELLGPMGRFTPTSLPTVALAPTLAMQSGTGASALATFDFLFAGHER